MYGGKVKVAVFVGNAWDPQSGREGDEYLSIPNPQKKYSVGENAGQ